MLRLSVLSTLLRLKMLLFISFLVALVAIGESAIVVAPGVFRIELQGLVEIGDGPVEFAFETVSDAAIVVGESIVRL